jgi:hypothetical protein
MTEAVMIKAGDNHYCAKNGSCAYKIICVECDTEPVTTRVCYARDCKVSAENKCLACGPLKKGIHHSGLCEKHIAEERVKCTCENCGTVSAGKYSCECCDKSFCDKCSKHVTVDISPITLFGYGLSVGRYATYCSGCTKGVTSEQIQKSFRDRDRDWDRVKFRCKEHDGLPYLLDRYPYICCERHALRSGKFEHELVLFDKKKDVVTKFHPRAYDLMRAYCDAHPEKVVTHDGYEFTFPEAPII